MRKGSGQDTRHLCCELLHGLQAPVLGASHNACDQFCAECVIGALVVIGDELFRFGEQRGDRIIAYKG